MEDQIFRTIDDSIKVVKDSLSKDIAEFRSLLYELIENLATKNNKLLRASIYLEGEALEWFRWLLQNKQLTDWEHFVAKLRICFRKQRLESSEGHMAAITEIEAQAFDNMSHGCCYSKVFAIERSDVEVLTDTTESALNNAKSEEIQMFHEGSLGNGNTHQSHSETLQPEVTTEVLVNQIENIQGVLQTFAESYSKLSPNIQADKTVRLLLVVCGLVYKARSTSPYFSFDPSFGLFTTIVGAARYCSVMFVDDFKQIIRILECHIDFIPNDLCILNQFPFDPGSYLFMVSLVNLSDWAHAKALIEREPNISYICSQYYRVTELIFGATKYTTAIGIWSSGSVLVEKNAKEEIVKPWPLMDLASLDALSKLSQDQIFFDWMSCWCGGTEKNMPSCDQNLLLPNFFISPCRNIKFQQARITDCYLLAQQPAMNLFVWDPGILSKFMALTSYAVNIAALLLVGSTGKFYLILYTNCMAQVWDLGQKWGIHSYLLLTDFALVDTRCGADDFIIFILRPILDPGDRIIEFLPDSSLYEFASLHTCSLTMMENVLLLDDVEADLMKRASIVVVDSVHRPMIIEGKSTSILVGPNSRVGKVTTTGRLMCYLAYFVGCLSIAEHSRDQQLLESNPVLELISNTKTVQTDNSSCCGIFLETQFDKSRRVFVPTEMNKRCSLGDPESFDYLIQSCCYELVSVTGSHGSLGIKKVMEIVELKVKEQEAIFRFVASVLPLGNLELAKGTEFESSLHKVDRHGSTFDTYSSLDRFTNIILSWLYSNLEDKVLFEGGSIVVNQDNSNNVYGPDIWTEVVGPGAKPRRGSRFRNPNKRFVRDPGEGST
ncbi:myosin-11 [Nicotiana attenuata]|uniref:Myosin-11 n=1 Tax=Nicotiana attenuata TaxID=49451 RepID=A0A1J6JSZ5_NICAT|nr:myosin-11 [Nicotiana attenuata]